MALAVRNATSTANGSTTGTSWTITKPTGALTGDLMLCGMTTNLAGVPTAPTGWTVVRAISNTTASSNHGFIVCYRILLGADPGSWTDGVRASGAYQAHTIAYGGINATTPILVDAAPAVSATPTTLASPTVNNTVATSWRVSIVGVTDTIVNTTMVIRLTDGAGVVQTQRGYTGQDPGTACATAFADSNAAVATGNQNTFVTSSGATAGISFWMGFIAEDPPVVVPDAGTTTESSVTNASVSKIGVLAGDIS